MSLSNFFRWLGSSRATWNRLFAPSNTGCIILYVKVELNHPLKSKQPCGHHPNDVSLSASLVAVHCCRHQPAIAAARPFSTMMRSLLLLSLLLASVSAFVPVSPTFTRHSSPLAVAIDTSDIKNGLTVEIDGDPYKVLSFSIMKQARGAAKTTIKFKNLVKGNTIENTYRSGEKFETAMIEKVCGVREMFLMRYVCY